jgi:hypothetical protein
MGELASARAPAAALVGLPSNCDGVRWAMSEQASTPGSHSRARRSAERCAADTGPLPVEDVRTSPFVPSGAMKGPGFSRLPCRLGRGRERGESRALITLPHSPCELSPAPHARMILPFRPNGRSTGSSWDLVGAGARRMAGYLSRDACDVCVLRDNAQPRLRFDGPDAAEPMVVSTVREEGPPSLRASRGGSGRIRHRQFECRGPAAPLSFRLSCPAVAQRCARGMAHASVPGRRPGTGLAAGAILLWMKRAECRWKSHRPPCA